MRSLQSGYGRRMGISTAASIILHILVIFLAPVGFRAPVDIYPVEYGATVEAILAEASPESSLPAVSVKGSRVAEKSGSKGSTTVVVKREKVAGPAAPSQESIPKPESKQKMEQAAGQEPVMKQEPEPEPSPRVETQRESQPEPKFEGEGRHKTGPAPVAAKAPVERQASGQRVQQPEVLTSPGGEETIASGPAEGGGKPAAASGAGAGQGGAGVGAKGGSANGSASASSGIGEAGANGNTTPGAGNGKEDAVGRGLDAADFGTGEGLAISRVRPVYPKDAQNEGVGGVVEALAEIDQNGKLLGVKIASSSGDARIDNIVLRTMQGSWSFKGIGVPYRLRVAFSFDKERVTVQFGGITLVSQ